MTCDIISQIVLYYFQSSPVLVHCKYEKCKADETSEIRSSPT